MVWESSWPSSEVHHCENASFTTKAFEGSRHHTRTQRSTKAVGTIAETFSLGIKPTEVVVVFVVDESEESDESDDSEDDNNEDDEIEGDSEDDGWA
mmetsp:Transcript_88380/g.176721  ORF Transcript_88380/g.176721 Transcript_88380/m.176721 type:complete len:96 (-) Transcript_88380:35-322(-)